MNVTLIFLTAITFIIYGYLCLTTNHMEAEFKRYGLSKFRKLTGALELLGGVGLILGINSELLLYMSSTGLALLMFLGVIIRLRTKDPLFQIIPAFVLMIINLFIIFKLLLS